MCWLFVEVEKTRHLNSQASLRNVDTISGHSYVSAHLMSYLWILCLPLASGPKSFTFVFLASFQRFYDLVEAHEGVMPILVHTCTSLFIKVGISHEHVKFTIMIQFTLLVLCRNRNHTAEKLEYCVKLTSHAQLMPW